MIFTSVYFKTQVVPNFSKDHNLVRIGLCDNVGRTFYGEYLDSSDISKLNIAQYSNFKPNPDDFLINQFGFMNVITQKEVKMLGTKDMISAELQKWMEFYSKDVEVDWIGFYGWYDVCILNDILWKGDIPENIREMARRFNERTGLTYEYAIKFENPLKFALDLRKEI